MTVQDIKRKRYITFLEESRKIGEEILANDIKNDNFIEEVENMNEHLQIAINILKKEI